MKKYVFTVLFTVVACVTNGQLTVGEWQLLQANTPQKSFLYVYTKWCVYCAAFDKNTLRSKVVQEQLTKKYRYVAFNAEDTSVINWMGKQYGFVFTGYKTGYHSWLQTILPIKQMEYPAWVILDKNNKAIQFGTGYISSKKMAEILQNH